MDCETKTGNAQEEIVVEKSPSGHTAIVEGNHDRQSDDDLITDSKNSEQESVHVNESLVTEETSLNSSLKIIKQIDVPNETSNNITESKCLGTEEVPVIVDIPDTNIEDESREKDNQVVSNVDVNNESTQSQEPTTEPNFVGVDEHTHIKILKPSVQDDVHHDEKNTLEENNIDGAVEISNHAQESLNREFSVESKALPEDISATNTHPTDHEEQNSQSDPKSDETIIPNLSDKYNVNTNTSKFSSKLPILENTTKNLPTNYDNDRLPQQTTPSYEKNIPECTGEDNVEDTNCGNEEYKNNTESSDSPSISNSQSKELDDTSLSKSEEKNLNVETNVDNNISSSDKSIPIMNTTESEILNENESNLNETKTDDVVEPMDVDDIEVNNKAHKPMNVDSEIEGSTECGQNALTGDAIKGSTECAQNVLTEDAIEGSIDIETKSVNIDSVNSSSSENFENKGEKNSNEETFLFENFKTDSETILEETSNDERKDFPDPGVNNISNKPLEKETIEDVATTRQSLNENETEEIIKATEEKIIENSDTAGESSEEMKRESLVEKDGEEIKEKISASENQVSAEEKLQEEKTENLAEEKLKINDLNQIEATEEKYLENSKIDISESKKDIDPPNDEEILSKTDMKIEKFDKNVIFEKFDCKPLTIRADINIEELQKLKSAPIELTGDVNESDSVVDSEVDKDNRDKKNAQEKENSVDKTRERLKEKEKSKAKEDALKRAKEEAQKKAKEDALKKAKEEAQKKAKEDALKKAKEEAQKRAKEDALKKAKEEAQKKAKEDALKKAKEEAQKKAKEDALKKAKEEAQKKAKEDALRKAKEEAQKKAKEEAQKKSKERIKAQDKNKEKTKEPDNPKIKCKKMDIEEQQDVVPLRKPSTRRIVKNYYPNENEGDSMSLRVYEVFKDLKKILRSKQQEIKDQDAMKEKRVAALKAQYQLEEMLPNAKSVKNCHSCKKLKRNVYKCSDESGIRQFCSLLCGLKYALRKFDLQTEEMKVRLCNHCHRLAFPSDKTLMWKSDFYCDEICLGKTFYSLGENCYSCRTQIQSKFRHKFGLKRGSLLVVFCSSQCRAQFKLEKRFCIICSKVPELDSVQVFGDHNFCSEKCLSQLELFIKPSKNLICIVCHMNKTAKYTVLQADMVNHLCSEKCFKAYNFVNKLVMVQCKLCDRHFDRKRQDDYCRVCYFDDIPVNFCSNLCYREYITGFKLKVPCSWCKDEKNETSMIRRVVEDQEYFYCTLPCLQSLTFQKAVNAKSKQCDHCKTYSTEYYYIHFYPTNKAFCTYKCVYNYHSNIPYVNPNQLELDNSQDGMKNVGKFSS